MDARAINEFGMAQTVQTLLAENARLKAAGDRILGLMSRISDQATDEQATEHLRMVDSLRRIWAEAKRPGEAT